MFEALFSNHEKITGLFFREVFAFALTCGWALILYPLSRKFRLFWGLLIFTATVFTIALLYSRESNAQPVLLTDVLVSSLFGACFGVAIICNFFFLKTSETAFPDISGIGESLFSRYGIQETPSLRLLFQLAIGLKDESKTFFTNIAAGLSDPGAIDTCKLVVAKVGKYRDFLRENLHRWFPSPAKQAIISDLVDKVKATGTFFPQPGSDFNSEQIVQLAIVLETRFSEFFQIFEKSYPEDWKNMQIVFLVQTQEQQIQEFRKMLTEITAGKKELVAS